MTRVVEHVGPAELRARKAASVALGVALLVYTVADLLAIRDQPAMPTQWWWIASSTGRLAFGVAFLAIPWFAGAAMLRLLACSFLAFGSAMVLVFFTVADADFTWVLRAQSLYVWAAPLAVRPLSAWAWILVFESFAAAARATRASNPFQFLESTLVALTMTVLLVSLLMVFLRMTRARDRQERSALRAISRDTHQAARTAELRRIERIVHDEVLSTLRAASLGLATERTSPALLAGAALEHLAALDRRPNDLTASSDPGTLVEADELPHRLRALATAVAPETEVRIVNTGAPEIPAEALEAIVEACGEALRNSVVHAPDDRQVSRMIRARIEPGGIEVTVEDDGDGFDLGRLPTDRLGIARSIVERMRSLPGGDAILRSTARAGTSVTVSWRP